MNKVLPSKQTPKSKVLASQIDCSTFWDFLEFGDGTYLFKIFIVRLYLICVIQFLHLMIDITVEYFSDGATKGRVVFDWPETKQGKVRSRMTCVFKSTESFSTIFYHLNSKENYFKVWTVKIKISLWNFYFSWVYVYSIPFKCNIALWTKLRNWKWVIAMSGTPPP